jgi:phosphate transport system substrate-binding protein
VRVSDLKRNSGFVILCAFILLISSLTAGCGSPDSPDAQTTANSPAFEQANLIGAGATFPQYLYTKWFDEYYKLTGVKINYQGIGSSGGIQQITAKNVDFGASDGIMNNDQQMLAEQSGGPIWHIPMTSGSVAVTYNLPEVDGQLKLTGPVLADIFLKKILKWNEAPIVELNPGLDLPDADIAVVHRNEGSGTTFIYTNYLSKVSEEWRIKVGNGTSVSWPGDVGGQGSAGVAAQVQQIRYSIGYVEMAYAKQNGLPMALIQNKTGNYIEPSINGTTKAAEGIDLPEDMRIMITNSANPEAYPIAGFTWILAYMDQPDKAKGQTLANMLWWAIHDGQQYCEPLDYAPLSSEAVARAENQILSLNYNGEPFITR